METHKNTGAPGSAPGSAPDTADSPGAISGTVPGTVGIVGLGLIGGSFARAYHQAGWRVLAYDRNPDVERAARVESTDGRLDADSMQQCDLILLAVYTQAAIDWLQDNAALVAPHTTVIDCCGVKRTVVEACAPLARRYGFTFVGGHPMAGTQYSGFGYARADLFCGAPMVLVPPFTHDAVFLEKTEALLAPAGFASFMITTAEEHDRRIAYTSQLAHVVSSAYIKSPQAQGHDGFSAGSYRDMTRVAWLNEPMWAELFLENADNLEHELDLVIGELQAYKDAIAAADKPRLLQLLRDGTLAKERAEGGA